MARQAQRRDLGVASRFFRLRPQVPYLSPKTPHSAACLPSLATGRNHDWVRSSGISGQTTEPPLENFRGAVEGSKCGSSSQAPVCLSQWRFYSRLPQSHRFLTLLSLYTQCKGEMLPIESMSLCHKWSEVESRYVWNYATVSCSNRRRPTADLNGSRLSHSIERLLLE